MRRFPLSGIFLAITIAAMLRSPLARAESPSVRLKALILTGESDEPYHHWRSSTEFIEQMLRGTGRFDVRVLEQVPGLTAATLAPFDVLVLNYNGPRWGDESEKAVEQFVAAGKGLISFHSATYGPLYGMQFDAASRRWTRSAGVEGWPAYASLIGARWDPAKIGHGRRHVFPVKWVDRNHPISRRLAPDFLANDELYHRLDVMPNASVLASAFSDPATGGTGASEPIVWTTSFGKGRTVHITLGHDLSAMAQPGFGLAFARGAEWAATGSVTLPETWNLSPQKAGAPSAREKLSAFVEAGKGIVSIHHAIVDYTAWTWWYENVIGGKFFVSAKPGHPASSYKEGVNFVVPPTKQGSVHPITRDVGPLVVNDEAYRGMWLSPNITVLMETRHELNDPPVVYLGPDPTIRDVYIQMGHSDSTLRYPGYRKLVRNTILWSAGRL